LEISALRSQKLIGKFTKAGVFSDLRVIRGAVHGYADPKVYDPATYADTVQFLKQQLQTP
jgi:hypothetical protein